MGATSYKQLEVWEMAMDVANLMPKREEYRLTAQMIRAAISVPANIAEGHTRATRKDYAHFISISRGSNAELETLLLLAIRTDLLKSEVVTPVLDNIDRVSRMLNRLHTRLKDNPNPQSRIPNPET